MDLVREILIHIEEKDRLIQGYHNVNFESADDANELWAHVELMHDGKLLRQFHTNILLDQGRMDYVRAYNLTWQGYEFLESIRDEDTWKKTKDLCEENKSGLSIAIIREAVILIFRQALLG